MPETTHAKKQDKQHIAASLYSMLVDGLMVYADLILRLYQYS